MIYKRGKVWHVRIKWRGREIRKSTGTSSREQARRIEAAVRLQVIDRSFFKKDPAESLRLNEVWEKYLKEDACYKAAGTYQRAQQCAKNFLPVIGRLTLSEITPAVLSSYRAARLEQGMAMATVAKELQFIRRVFSLCKKDWQLVRQSPFEFFRMPAVNNERVRFLDAGQFEKLLRACPQWLRPMVILASFTGLRKGNIINLTWQQIDLVNRVIHLDKTKNGQPLGVPLTETAIASLEGVTAAKVVHISCPYVFHKDGKPYSPYQVSMAFRRAAKRAGIDNFRFHDCRHQFASNLVQRGNDLYVVQSLMGHKDSRMTQRYAHLRMETLRNAVETLEKGHKKGHTEEKIKGFASANP